MKSIISLFLSLLCIVLSAVCIKLYHDSVEQKRTSEFFENQLSEMQEKEKDGLIVRRISKQMEDIAYQQKEVSDRQREEAITQTRIANEMRIQAEKQRQNAEIAKKQAIKAFELAEEQRVLAEEKKNQAEYAKNVADTLGYIALARSLSSLSQIQYQAQNYDLAALMAYAAYTFAVRYGGNLYFPEIYNALVINSHAVSVWNEHKGGISHIITSPKESDIFYSVSKYGEIICWNQEEQLSDSLLFRDSSFDFRDIYIDSNRTVYALSYDGRMVVIPVNEDKYVINIPGKGNGFQFLFPIEGNVLVSIAGDQLFFYSKDNKDVIRTTVLPCSVCAMEKVYEDYFLFGENGVSIKMESDGTLQEEKFLSKKINNRITACTWSEKLKMMALGTFSGTIYLLNEQGQVVKTLLGHQSAITQLLFKDVNLFSSSYDLHLKMWNRNWEPINLSTAADWIYCFNMTDDNSIWIGDKGGALSKVIISPVEMANRIKDVLSREFTKEEWDTYIGVNIPYESFKYYKYK